MKGFFDSSVVLRKIFRQSEDFKEWSKIKMGFSSRLLRLECLRTIDRMRLMGDISDQITVEYRSRLFSLLSHMGLLPLTGHILDRAEQPFATPLGSLDSIHLATALLWREQHGDDFVFCTHDQQLATAAKAHGLNVLGV